MAELGTLSLKGRVAFIANETELVWSDAEIDVPILVEEGRIALDDIRLVDNFLDELAGIASNVEPRGPKVVQKLRPSELRERLT